MVSMSDSPGCMPPTCANSLHAESNESAGPREFADCAYAGSDTRVNALFNANRKPDRNAEARIYDYRNADPNPISCSNLDRHPHAYAHTDAHANGNALVLANSRGFCIRFYTGGSRRTNHVSTNAPARPHDAVRPARP